MDKSLGRDSVEKYIRDTMEPVSYSMLINEFSNHSKKEECRKYVKAQLENILHTSIDSGSIVKYNDHFFSSYLPEDLESVVHFMADEELPSELSNISFSSCESFVEEKGSSSSYVPESKHKWKK